MKDIIISFMYYYENIDPRVMFLELIKAMKYIICLNIEGKIIYAA